VAYETQAGWSEETYRSVEFAKGHEIIEHWPAIEMHSLYAMLWFGKGQVVLVKLPTGSLILGGELEVRDITSLFSFERRVEGSQTNLSDRKPRRWRLRRCY
jgi:hypothetical protein